MRRCEVLVVGGGPAGAACARALVRAGIDVLVVDKKSFPRDKVCAGWVTPQLLQTLALDIGDYAGKHVLQPVSAFRTGLIGGEVVETRYDEVVSYGIRRCEFDHYLLKRSGARLALGCAAKRIERQQGLWRVNGDIEAPLLIGAGGHFCPVARLLSGDVEESVVAAQEIEFAMDARQAEACAVAAEVPELYFCHDLLGYGWCFRKGDYLNIGLGRQDKHRLTEHVRAFSDWLGRTGHIPAGMPGSFKGHAYLLYGAGRRPWVGDGVLLIGDAAGLASRQSGEGIRPAVESGLMAAQAVVACRGDYSYACLSGYTADLRRRFGNPGALTSAADLLPAKLARLLAPRLFASPWFTRHILLDRWFLHRQLPVLHPME